MDSTDLQAQLSTTLQTIIQALEAMQNSNDQSDSAIMTRMAEMEVEWEHRRSVVLDMVTALRVEAAAAPAPAPTPAPAPESMPISSPQSDPQPGQYGHVVRAVEPRLPAGDYHISVVNVHADGASPSASALKLGVDVVSLAQPQIQHRIFTLEKTGESGELTASFTVHPEDAPASLLLVLSPASSPLGSASGSGSPAPASTRTSASPSAVTSVPAIRCTAIVSKVTYGGAKRFLFFNSDAAVPVLHEICRVAIGYLEDIAEPDCHEAILLEAVQRRLCPDVEAARYANQGRVFVRYHRRGLPVGTYTHYLTTKPIQKPEPAPMSAPSANVRPEDLFKNPPGQSVFFLRHGATDLFAFRDVVDGRGGSASVGLRPGPGPETDAGVPALESVDYVRVPPETQRTAAQEDEVDYVVAMDQLPSTQWRRIRDPSLAFSSREELMDCVHHPAKYEAQLMLEIL